MIVPFVLEATGRPSDHTRNFLKSVFAGEAFGRVANRLLARIGLIIMRYNVMMIKSFRKKHTQRMGGLGNTRGSQDFSRFDDFSHVLLA